MPRGSLLPPVTDPSQVQGLIGIANDQTSLIAPNTLQGSQGPQGEQGIQGIQGVAGVAGEDAFNSIDAGSWSVDLFEEYDDAETVIDKGRGWDGAAGIANGQIVTANTTNSRTEKRLRLDNGVFIRKFGFGNDWHWVKAAFLVTFPPGPEANTNVQYFWGFNSGNSVAGSAYANNATNFIGTLHNWFNPNVAWNYDLSAKFPRYTQSVSWNGATMRGSTRTSLGGASGSPGRTFPAYPLHKGLILMSLVRPQFATSATSVTYTFINGQPGGAPGAYATDDNIEKSMVVDVLQTTDSLGNVGNNGLLRQTSFVTASISYNESTGPINSIELSFPTANFPMEISAVAVRKMN